ncbi:hypothetical protein PQX77_010328 [Marasmius sp. AFHP31]|nr:hypothetical protein PQX77_010328 [Marasmius sp. AFHP31]
MSGSSHWSRMLLITLLSFTRASYYSLVTPNSTSTTVLDVEETLFTPVESLEFISESEFTIISHPLFPGHSARIKKSHFCDHTVNAYTGYIDIEARHLFFYFFESRSEPEEDDVIFWINGGPGGSAGFGLFMELGPCRILDDHGPKFHPESWNSKANIFFVDQPVGVGFSYAEYGESVSTTEEAAQDIAAFIAIFFENFNQFKGRPFHMAGESYGGYYIPHFASAVYDQNAALVKAGLTPVNLNSTMIGKSVVPQSGYDDDETDILPCGKQATQRLIPTRCSGPTMTLHVERCKRWTKAACLDQYDAIGCGAAFGWCEEQITGPFLETGLNPYYYSDQCNGTLEEDLCSPAEIKHVNTFLSNPKVRKQLGVDSHPALPANFSLIGWNVTTAFSSTQDALHPSTPYVAALLERGIRTLIYVGTYDWICNWVGNERWMLDLEWSGAEVFRNDKPREWVVDGKVAGKTRGSGLLTFATVDAAGHMVPYYKPKESLEMVIRWMYGKGL